MQNSIFKKAAAITMACMMTAVMFAGCGDGTTTPAAPDQGGTTAPAVGDKMFNVALTAPFSGFDPLRTNDSASTYVNAQIYETLYRINPTTNEYECLLAETFPEFSEDGLTATIKVKEGIKFHDGTPFNAEAVKYTLDLIKNPEFPSGRASIAASIASIEVPDEYTLVLHLSYEDGVLLAKLAHTNAAIVSPTAQAKQDLMVDPVGTGPYKFVSSVSGSNVVLTRNDEYWGGAPAVKDVTMTVIAEESTAVARMETGEADFMPKLSVEQIARVEAIPTVEVITSPSAQVFYISMRGESSVNPVMKEKDFRTAIAKAIDKKGYVEFMMDNQAEAANGLMGPKIFGFTEEGDKVGYAYDPAGAKAILDKNGWADEEIKFLVPSTPVYTKMGEYFQANLTEAGFTNVKIETMDWSAWQTESKADNRFDITLAAWSNVTRDGSELFEPNFHSETGSNRTRAIAADAAEIDKLIDASKQTADKDVRIENLQAVNKLICENAYAVPLYHGENLYCLNNAYTGLVIDSGGTFYLKDVTLK